MISLDRLESLLSTFPDRTIGLVGDLFLDRYLEILAGPEELSLETGLEAYQVSRVRNSPAALGTVISNLAALGAGQLLPVTVVGDDGHAVDLLRQLESLPVDPRYIVRSDQRLTPTYMKPLRQQRDGSWRELNRLDIRTRAELSDAVRAQVCRAIDRVFAECDGIILLDQISEPNQGVIDDRVRGHLRARQRMHAEKLVFIDSRTQLGAFDFGCLKGNRSEILAAAGVSDPRAALSALAQRTAQPAFCTCGEEGILVGLPGGPVETGRRVECVPGCPVEGPIDIVGAGDSATSGIVLSLRSRGHRNGSRSGRESCCLDHRPTVRHDGVGSAGRCHQPMARDFHLLTTREEPGSGICGADAAVYNVAVAGGQDRPAFA